MKVNAIQCPKCKDVIYSRTRHDFRSCTCGEVQIDGGFDYVKISFNKVCPNTIKIDVKASKQQLHNDWSCAVDYFGLIKGCVVDCFGLIKEK